MEEIFYLKDETYQIMGCAMTVLNTLGHGFNEKVYENALAVELKEKNIPFTIQPQFIVKYKDFAVGTYIPDMIVFNKIVIEMKTIDKITNHEKGQLLNYLKTTRLKVGLVLNFKNSKLEWQRIAL